VSAPLEFLDGDMRNVAQEVGELRDRAGDGEWLFGGFSPSPRPSPPQFRLELYQVRHRRTHSSIGPVHMFPIRGWGDGQDPTLPVEMALLEKCGSYEEFLRDYEASLSASIQLLEAGSWVIIHCGQFIEQGELCDFPFDVHATPLHMSPSHGILITILIPTLIAKR
jgi:hypothetical protein